MKPHHLLAGVGRLSVLLAASPTLLVAQSASVGNLSGTVVGPGQKPLAGAYVQVDTGRGIREARTDAGGKFFVPQLLPGTVQVRVSASGMEGFRTKATVFSNQTVVLNVPLSAVAQANVEVVAVLPPDVGVDPTAAVSGKNFDAASIATLPSIGSPYDAAMATLPGTPQGGYNLHGSDDGSNNFTINGVESRSAGGGQQILPLNKDLIEQFNVLTDGISAKYGRFVGGVVNTVTKSGTNTFEGSLRHDLTSQSWNALPRQSEFTDSKRVPRRVIDAQTYTFLGPIIKDTLFFAVGYKVTTPSATTVTTASVGSKLFPSYQFSSTSTNELKDIKLDWQLNTSNKVSASWSRYLTTSTNGTYGKGMSTVATGSGPTRNEVGYKSISYASTLTNSLLLDVIASETTTKSGGSGTGSQGGDGVITWVDMKGNGNGDKYDNGTVSSNLNQEKIRTLGINLTWAGTQHSLETGFQLYHSRIDSMGSSAPDAGWLGMTPSRAEIRFYGWTVAAPPSMDRSYRNLVQDNANSTRLILFDPLQGGSDSRVASLFVNDVWRLDNHWNFNLGLRYDHTTIHLDPEGDRFSNTTVTPRLSATFDPLGNGRNRFTLSLAEYAGQYDASTFSATSVSNSVPVRLYRYYGSGNGSDALNADGSVNWSVWGKAAGSVGQANPYFATPNPLTNRVVTADPGTKAPRAREASLAYRYEDSAQSLTATVIHKVQDHYVGLRYLGVPGTEANGANQQYFTDDGMKTRYEGLELQYQRQITTEFKAGGNLTWSYTRANAGQGVGTSSRNQFGNLIPNDLVDPFGPQSGQWSSSSTPFTLHLDLGYTHDFGKYGKVDATLLGNFWSRSFSGYRGYTGPTNADVQSYGYPDSVTRYYAGSPLWWPQQYSVDFHLGYEVAVYRGVKAFTALDVLNLFNHMMPMYIFHSTGLSDGTKTYAPYDSSIAAAYPTWYLNPALKPVPYSNDGQVGDYTTPRQIQVSLGVRF